MSIAQSPFGVIIRERVKKGDDVPLGSLENNVQYLSPSKTVEVRLKNLEQLKLIQQLFEDSILTKDEYLEQKAIILSSLNEEVHFNVWDGRDGEGVVFKGVHCTQYGGQFLTKWLKKTGGKKVFITDQITLRYS